VQLGSVMNDDTVNCPTSYPDILSPSEIAFGLTPFAKVGIASIGNQSARLVARAGYAVINTDCEGVCESPVLSRMKVILQDVTLFGIQFRSPTLELEGFAFGGSEGGIIHPGAMQMKATTTVLGAPFQTEVTNLQSMSIVASSSTLALSGQMVINVGNPSDDTNMPLTIWVQMSGSTSSPGTSCVGLDRTGKIMGFEDVTLWQSSQTELALSNRIPTQGCYALDVPGGGYRVLNSAPFSTPIAGTTSKFGLDVFIPTNPPNPYWLGAVQLYATCPSANMNNAYIGQVELTGKPLGAYSTLVFPIPRSIESVLTQTHPDCFVSIAVNSDRTPTPPTLDNLRFLP
jgi:hypothetical protein